MQKQSKASSCQTHPATHPEPNHTHSQGNQSPKNKVDTNSKRPLSEIEPRITRRMKKMANSTSSAQEKCAICLGDCQKESGKLTCGHKFCLQCVTKWWRDHPTCPYCREHIQFIENQSRQRIHFADLAWDEKEQDDANFIPHCQLCWGEIEPFEPLNICTECRAVYWHRNCLPFTSTKWYCVDCAGENEEQDQE